MAEPFKNRINAATVAILGTNLQRVWPDFDRTAFEHPALAGLQALALKARVMQLATALEATLPSDFTHAADVIEASLAPPLALDAKGEPVTLTNVSDDNDMGGIGGWAVWPLGEFVARRGLHDVPRALLCLHAITQRFTAEFAIRPFIQQHPQLSLSLIHISEPTRPY